MTEVQFATRPQRDAGKRDAEEPVILRLLRPAADGSSTATTRVLLLHGLATSSSTWDAFAGQAVPACELWTADLPWRGDGVGDWAEHTDVASWAARAMAEVPDGADVVIAHSFGANVLLEHLAQLPAGEQPGAVVLVSPFYRNRTEEFDWAAISYYLNDFHRILAEGIRVRAGGRLDPERQHDMALRVRDRVGPYGWVRFFETYLRTPRLPVSRIALPCLLVCGELDFAAFPSDTRALAAVLPDARAHIIPDCGHFAMAERAEEFGAVVNEFIANHLEPRSQQS